MIVLNARQKKLLRIVGYPLLAITVFVFALARTFPYERIIPKLEHALASWGEIEVADIGPGFLPGDVVLEGVALKAHPKKAGEKPFSLYIDKLVIDVAVLRLIRSFGSSTAVEVMAEVGIGQLEVEFEKSGATWAVRGETEEFPLEMLPPSDATNGLPLAGGLNAEFELEVEGKKYSKANGFAKLSCTGCTIGDGKTKAKPLKRPGRRKVPTLEGPTVPKLSLGIAEAELKIKDGDASLFLSSKSPDGELGLDWKTKLQDKVGQSKLTGCTKFRLDDSLKDRAASFVNIQFSMSANKGDDGLIALPFHRMATLAYRRMDSRNKCGAAADKPRPSIPSRPAPRTRPSTNTPRKRNKPSPKPTTPITKPPPETKPPPVEPPEPRLRDADVRDGDPDIDEGDEEREEEERDPIRDDEERLEDDEERLDDVVE